MNKRNGVVLMALVCLNLFTLLAVPVCAEESKLGRDDFFSNAISDVVQKVDEYATGKKDILTPNARGMEARDRTTEDPLGRKVPDAIKPLKRPATTE